MRNLRLIPVIHNIRSTYNVGAILRTCDGLGITEVIFSGYTPYPGKGLPHEQEKLKKEIHKTALGAEESVRWTYVDDIIEVLRSYKRDDWQILALEQGEKTQNLASFGRIKQNSLLILGEEVHGVPKELLDEADLCLEIPMCGKKESFNVSVAAALAFWELVKPQAI